MGIYIFTWKALRKALLEDHSDPNSDKDFGKNVIPRMLSQGKRLFAYRFSGYWKDVGTIKSYYESQMELLEKDSPINIFERSLRIFSNSNNYAPALLGPESVTKNSLVCNGCVTNGDVKHSILASGCQIRGGTKIRDSIILPRAEIGKDCILTRVIVNEGVHVKDGSVIGSRTGDITVVGKDVL